MIKLLDVFFISEWRLDLTYSSNQFGINGYKTFRFDHNRFEGVLILYINKECKSLQDHVHLPNFEIIAVEFYQSDKSGFF